MTGLIIQEVKGVVINLPDEFIAHHEVGSFPASHRGTHR
jgi:hypothetical protein